MYHKGPFHAPVGSISGQRWNDILCHLWGIKDTLWAKGSQVFKWLETGRLLVWNLNSNSDSKLKLLPPPCAQERFAEVVRRNEVGWVPQDQAKGIPIGPVTMGTRVPFSYITWWAQAYQALRAREGPPAWKIGKKIKIKQNKWKSSTRFSVNAAGWIWSEKFCFIQVSASMFLPWGIRSTLAPCLFDFFSLIYNIKKSCMLFFSLYLLLDYNSMWTWSICFSLWKDIAWLREGTCKQLLNEWMKAP